MTADAVLYQEFTEAALSCLKPLYGAAHRFTRNAADADDLVQETYRSAFQHYRELRDLKHCRAWLSRILHRQAVTRHRHQQCGPPLVCIDHGANDGTNVVLPTARGADLVEQISLQEVQGAIESLPDDLRIAVTMCDVEGFSYAEIAQRIDCPVGTVRSRIARARAKLMQRLQTHALECGIVPERRRQLGGSLELSGANGTN